MRKLTTGVIFPPTAEKIHVVVRSLRLRCAQRRDDMILGYLFWVLVLGACSGMHVLGVGDIRFCCESSYNILQ